MHKALSTSYFKSIESIEHKKCHLYYHTYACVGLPPVILVKKFFQVSMVLPHLWENMVTALSGYRRLR